MSFFTEALPYARQASANTGVLTSVILAQWAEETGYGGVDWTVDHNPGNVGSFDGQPVNSFPTLQAGVNAYIQTMNNGYYRAVKAAIGWQAQCYALGNSPWASAHYESSGGPPGEDLVKIVQANHLTQFDSGPPPPPPPTPPNQVIKPTSGRYGMLNAPIVAICPTNSGAGYTLVGADGGTFNYGDAAFLGSLGGDKLNAPIVAAVRTPDGNGLILAATDGGVFCFGTAVFHGSMGGTKLAAPIISIGVSHSGNGYWLTGADGGIFTFGDAVFEGSAA